jgi:protein TonB
MERAIGLIFVVALHAAALWGLWQYRLIPAPQKAMTLFVSFIAPPEPDRPQEPKQPPPPKAKPIEKPKQIIAATAAVVAPADYVVPAPSTQPAPTREIEAPVVSKPLPPGPVALATELAVACPERSAPTYPALSRRLEEEGTVVLRVELDETGRVSVAGVHRSSGFARLDEAALGAVRTWRCTPAQRNGHPVRAVAMQPFKFILQGN